MKQSNKSLQLSFYCHSMALEDMVDHNCELYRLALSTDWDLVEALYSLHFPSNKGRPAYSSRFAYGCVYLQQKFGMSDRAFVERVKHDAAVQLFLGFTQYDPVRNKCSYSLLPRLRERITQEMLDLINERSHAPVPRSSSDPILTDEEIARVKASFPEKKASKKESSENTDDDSFNGGNRLPGFDDLDQPHSCEESTPSDASVQEEAPVQEVKKLNYRKDMSDDALRCAILAITSWIGFALNKPRMGLVLLDATCAPVDIKYPTDLRLLHEARIWTEGIIDVFYKAVGGLNGKSKPRTYRKKINKIYKRFARDPKNQKNDLKLWDQIKIQLSCLKRNLGYISAYIQAHPGIELLLSNVQKERLETVKTLYEQQKTMFENGTHQIADRIVSVGQDWIRPIVRGKVRNKTEFGPKLAMSVINGFVFSDILSFDAFNEGASDNLLTAIEAYVRRTGYLPEKIDADKIYCSRENRRICSVLGITLSAPRLGRKPKHKDDIDRQLEKDQADRNTVECRFGNMKRADGLGLLKTKKPNTQLSQVSMALIIRNDRTRYLREAAAFA